MGSACMKLAEEIARVEQKIDRVEQRIEECELKIRDNCDVEYYREEKKQLREEKKQLREKENILLNMLREDKSRVADNGLKF